MKRSLRLMAVALLVASCDIAPDEVLAPHNPSDMIMDANQNTGNQAFFWLAPIINNNTFSGVFNPRLKPRVVICELDLNLGDCAQTTGGVDVVLSGADWTLATGLTLQTDHYQVEWHTDQTATNFSAAYRIQVFLTALPGSERLGFADVQFFNNGQELKDINSDQSIALRDGRTLPIKFRIEEGVSCNGGTDCGEAVIGTGGGTVTAASGEAGVEIPAGAVDGDILITIRKVDPATQPWGRCLPTGLRQEEGCYDFDTEPAISDVQSSGLDQFNTDVIVGVCLDPNAVRPDRLTLHKYDDENPTDGVVELPGAVATFLTCPTSSLGAAGDGFFGWLAHLGKRTLRPMVSMVAPRPLYADDKGLGGSTDAFSFVGWAEPVLIGASGVPVAVLPESPVPGTLGVTTAHNHNGTLDPVVASGHTLRVVYTDPDPATVEAALASVVSDAAGAAAPAWTITAEIGVHTIEVSTRMEIDVAGVPTVIPDPTPLLNVEVGGYTSANTCDGQTDCGIGVVDGDGGVVTTEGLLAGVEFPAGAVDGPILITIKRVDPATQPWGRCLPTGLRQEEGCYDFDTEPAISQVQSSGLDQFNSDVVVGVCLDPDATRPDRMTLHKYDPENALDGVVELPGAAETFLQCPTSSTIGAASDGFFGRLAHLGKRAINPVVRLVAPRPLYGDDKGLGGSTDAFSFIGWAEPVQFTADAPLAVVPGNAVPATVNATTTHNHNGTLTPADASGHTLRFVYTDPAGTEAVLGAGTTATSGDAAPAWTLTSVSGLHTVVVSTRMALDLNGTLTVIPDPTQEVAVTVGGFNDAGACDQTTSDCGQGIVGAEGGTVVTEDGFAGTEIPQGALDGPVLITVKRVDDPSQQPWGRCLPTGLRQEEGCYDFDTDPALGDVNAQDAFNDPVIVGVCQDPTAVRPDRLTLHKYDPEKPSQGVLELPGAAAPFLTCAGFASIPTDFLGRFAQAGKRAFSPLVSLVGPKPLYADDKGLGGSTDAFSFVGWAEPVTLSISAQPDATTLGFTDVVVTAVTAHNGLQSPLPADGATIRMEYTDPSGTLTVSEITTAIAGSGDAESRITLTTQGGAHHVAASTQDEILVEQTLITASGGAAGYGIFGAPSINLALADVPFLVPDPTAVVESGPITVLGLVSRWDADDVSARFADVIGPNDGAVTNGVVDATAVGIDGNGFYFDGTGGVVSSPARHIGDAPQFTVSAWVKPDPAGSVWEMQQFLTVGGVEGEKAVLRQEHAATGHIARNAHYYAGFGTDPNGTGADLHHIRWGSGLQEGCWQHLAGTYDGSQMTFYINGEAVASQAVDPAIAGDSHLATHVDFGSAIATGEFPSAFTGVLDEVAVHNYALSPTEVDQMFGQFLPGCDISTGVIGGVVNHGETGARLEGVTVTVSGTTLSALTDADGQYVIRDVPLGPHTVVATLDGFEDAQQMVEVADVGRTTGADHLNMVPVLEHPISGTVRYTGTGAGVTGIELYLTDAETLGQRGNVLAATVSAVDGSYGFPPFPDGTYVIRFNEQQGGDPIYEGIDGNAAFVTIAGGPQTLDIDLVKLFDLRLPENGASVGPQPRLVWQPAADATTYAISAWDINDVSNLHEATGVADTSYVVGTPLSPASYAWHVAAFNAVGTEVGHSGTSHFTVAPGSVSGVVTDRLTGAGIAGATVAVTADGVTTQAVTGFDGSYTIAGLTPSAGYTRAVLATGYHGESPSETVEVLAGQATTWDVALWPVAQRTASIKDPIGDHAGGVADDDIHEFGASTDGRTLSLWVSGRTGTFVPTGMIWFLDTDQNTLTGTDGTGEGRVGADFRVVDAARLERWTGSLWEEVASGLSTTLTDVGADPAGRTWTVTLSHALLGPDAADVDADMALELTSSSLSDGVPINADIAPDAGQDALLMVHPDDRTGTPVAHLTLQSESGDYVGQGGTYDLTYTPSNSRLLVATILTARNVGSEPAFVRFSLDGLDDAGNPLAGLDFATDRLGIPMWPGQYTGAQRASFADPGHAGLSVSFDHRGCNELTGQFTIHEARFIEGSSGTEIERLSASFTQYCDNSTAALHGTFTYDAHGGT